MSVLFESSRTRNNDIYLADFTARSFVNLTRRPGDDRFAGFLDGGRSALWRDWDARTYVVADLASGERQHIDGTERVWTIRTSRGRRVAFLRLRGDAASIVVKDL